MRFVNELKTQSLTIAMLLLGRNIQVIAGIHSNYLLKKRSGFSHKIGNSIRLGLMLNKISFRAFRG